MKTIPNLWKYVLTAVLLLVGTITASAQTWSAAPSMANNRELHTATLLSTGKVLVVGGHDFAGPAGSTPVCELYDSAANVWSAAASIAIGRVFHTATLLSNGQVLVVGGGVVGGITATCELYNPLTNTWASAAPELTGRYDHTATLLPNGKVLVAGGFRSMVIQVTGEVYDPVADSWTAVSNFMADGREFHTATLLPNGKVLLAGGESVGNVSLNTCSLYDPATNSFSPAGSMATGRYFATATLLSNGKVLITGGVNTVGMTSNAISSCELYDPVSNTWSAAGSMLNVRSEHTATMLSNGYVLVAGGGHPAFFSNSISTAELYNPATNSWSTAASMANSRYFHTATLLPNAKVLVTGGALDTGSGHITLANCELYGFVPCSPPVFSVCPGDITAATISTMATVFYTATISSNPPPMVTYSFTGATTANGSGTGSGSVFNIGVTHVVITATNGCCRDANCSFNVKIRRLTAGITDVEIIPFKVIVAPNPSNNQFTLLINGGNNEKTEVILYDISGRPINHIEKPDGQPILIGEELQVGEYFATVKQGANQETVRFIKRQ